LKHFIGVLVIAICWASLPNSVFCQADIDLLRNVNEHETAFKNNLFNALSKTNYMVSVGMPVGIFIAGLAKHDKQLQKQGAYMAGGYLVSTILTQSMKRIIKRDRPFITYPFIVKRSDGGGYSMPSGHTSSAFYTATALSLWKPKWYIVVPAFTWASLSGYGRMYEGVHYPSDIAVGALVGAGSAWLTYHAQKWIDKRQTKKNAVSTTFQF
jgi:membrane-associated phospholipid phosphatase